MTQKLPNKAAWNALLNPKYLARTDKPLWRLAWYLGLRYGDPRKITETALYEAVHDICDTSVWHWQGNTYRRFGWFILATDVSAYLGEKRSLSDPLLTLTGKGKKFSYNERNFYVTADPFCVDVVVRTPRGRLIEDEEVREYAEGWLHYTDGEM